MDRSPSVLRDPDLDAQLARDGFVVFPALDPSSLRGLRDVFGDQWGWDGSGFHSDLVIDDGDYRRRASKAISTVLDDAAGALFVDHQPFLRNFLCKYPGEDSGLYLHRDWMYVDERRGRHTYVVWAPLEDVTGHNGQLRVLRRSHHLDDRLRGSGLVADWLQHEKVIEPRLLSVPVPLGHVVVFDNALVHCSYPNHTAQPRVVAAVGMRPVGEPLVHFRRTGPDTAERYDVDEDFFCDATPQGLEQAPPDLPVAEELALAMSSLDARALAAALDAGPSGRADAARRVVRRSSAAVREVGEVRRRLTATTAARARATRSAAAAARRRAGSYAAELPSRAAIMVLGANEWYIRRVGPDTPAIWDPASFDWARRIEAGWPEVRAEVEALLEGPNDIPHIEDVTGGIPQGNIGPWRSFVMMHQGRWIDWNCERCPATTALVRDIPGLTVAGFSVLEPGTHITEHRGPNKGALRYQLGVIVPGHDGDCRIRVGDEMLVWRDGEGVMFDFTVPHEAWNDSDGIRVLLMLEVLTPLPWYVDRPNRVAQRAMGWFPTTRNLTQRLRTLEPTLRRG